MKVILFSGVVYIADYSVLFVKIYFKHTLSNIELPNNQFKFSSAWPHILLNWQLPLYCVCLSNEFFKVSGHFAVCNCIEILVELQNFWKLNNLFMLRQVVTWWGKSRKYNSLLIFDKFVTVIKNVSGALQPVPDIVVGQVLSWYTSVSRVLGGIDGAFTKYGWFISIAFSLYAFPKPKSKNLFASSIFAKYFMRSANVNFVVNIVLPVQDTLKISCSNFFLLTL